MIGRKNCTNSENLERFHLKKIKKIKGKAKLSLVTPPFVKPYPNNENNFDNITTANDNANLTHRPFDGFQPPRKAKTKNITLKHVSTLSKNPMEPP